MPNANERMGSFVHVAFDDGDWAALDLSALTAVREAFFLWRRERKDSAIEVTHREGHTVTFAGSDIARFHISTPEGREASTLEEIAIERWDREFRAEHTPKEWER